VVGVPGHHAQVIHSSTATRSAETFEKYKTPAKIEKENNLFIKPPIKVG
jgi:hypothetical protein